MATTNPAAKVKQTVRVEVEAFLYHKITESLQNRERAIVIRNTVLMKTGHFSCMHKGMKFNHDNVPAPRGTVTRLSPEFHEDMDALLKEREQVLVYEAAYVMGYITQALNIAGCLGDVLDLLPDSVHYPIKQYMPANSNIQRTKLDSDVIQELLTKNEKAITLMKTRMALNLFM